MRIVCISDTHLMHSPAYVLGEKSMLRASDIPEGDILIHAGDLTFNGTFRQIQVAGEWLATLPHPHKIVIAGNHDFLFQRDQAQAKHALGDGHNGIIYLEDSGAEVEGLKIWGSPWTPRFYDWAFQLNGEDHGKQHWKLIPDDTNILITHGPPWGTLDRTPRGEKVGDAALTRRARMLPDLKLHVFGHIHHSYGITKDSLTTFVNAALVDETYQFAHVPIVVDI